MRPKLSNQQIEDIRQRNNSLLAGVDLSETALAKAPKVSQNARESFRKAAAKAIAEARAKGLFQNI
jgi:hypothetical protein